MAHGNFSTKVSFNSYEKKNTFRLIGVYGEVEWESL
jgi:hypothetical protein